MFDWRSLITEPALASVLPGTYRQYVRPIQDGLCVFLGGLPPSRQGEVLAAQMALPLSATLSERLGAIARACPVLHKLGQIVARDQRIAAELRDQLRLLESLPPTCSIDEIQALAERELGPASSSHVYIVPPAIAEASVAIVVPFSLASADGPADSVLKILKPGIEERLEEELALLTAVGCHLDERCDDLGIPHLDYAEVFQQIQEKLRYEVRLDLEQQHLAAAADFYASDDRIQIPALREPCTPRVTAMQRIQGAKISAHSAANPAAQRRLADTVVQALIAAPIFSSAPLALFHSDPHAGNLMVTETGRLAILDWSLVGHLSERERVGIVQLLLAAASWDVDRLAKQLGGLCDRGANDAAALQSVASRGLAKLRAGQWPGLTWLTALLDDAALRAGLRFAPDLLLFRKSLHTLSGVVAEISGGTRGLDDAVLREFARSFALDWPRRFWRPPDSRDYRTRISNRDVTELLLSWPCSLARYWLGADRDGTEDRLADVNSAA